MAAGAGVVAGAPRRIRAEGKGQAGVLWRGIGGEAPHLLPSSRMAQTPEVLAGFVSQTSSRKGVGQPFTVSMLNARDRCGSAHVCSWGIGVRGGSSHGPLRSSRCEGNACATCATARSSEPKPVFWHVRGHVHASADHLPWRPILGRSAGYRPKSERGGSGGALPSRPPPPAASHLEQAPGWVQLWHGTCPSGRLPWAVDRSDGGYTSIGREAKTEISGKARKAWPVHEERRAAHEEACYDRLSLDPSLRTTAASRRAQTVARRGPTSHQGGWLRAMSHRFGYGEVVN